MRLKLSYSNREAFSLIEVVLSLLIISIILISMLSLLYLTAKSNKNIHEFDEICLISTSIFSTLEQDFARSDIVIITNKLDLGFIFQEINLNGKGKFDNYNFYWYSNSQKSDNILYRFSPESRNSKIKLDVLLSEGSNNYMELYNSMNISTFTEIRLRNLKKSSNEVLNIELLIKANDKVYTFNKIYSLNGKRIVYER